MGRCLVVCSSFDCLNRFFLLSSNNVFQYFDSFKGLSQHFLEFFISWFFRGLFDNYYFTPLRT